MPGNLRDALRAFYETYSRELFAYALSITADEACAEDAVHDAFSAVLSGGELPREIRPYLFRCVRNAAIDTRRHAAREARKCSLFAAETEEKHLRAQVDEVLHMMAGDERECVVLKVFGGLTFREISEVLHEPAGTVAARYWRALERIRKQLEIQT